MQSIFAIARKDLVILLRNRAGLFFTFIWPVVVAVMFGFIFAGPSDGGGRQQIRLIVVDEDASDGSRAFTTRLANASEFAIEESSRTDAENRVRLGQRSAFIVLKKGFGEGSNRMFYGTPRQIEIGSDPARAAEAGMIEGLVTKYAMEDMQKLLSDPTASQKMVGDALAGLKSDPSSQAQTAPIATFLGALQTFLATPLPAAPDGNGPGTWQPLQVTKVPVARQVQRGPSNTFQVTFPQGVMWGIIGCVMSFAISLVTERVRGTFVRLQTAPLTKAQLLGGKALACFLSISFIEVTLFAVGAAFLGVRPSSVPLLITICLCASAGFVGFMMMVSSLGKTEQAVSGAGWAILMPMSMIGGGMVPQFVMPPWMSTVGNISPVKWTILGLEGAIWRNFSAAEMVLPCVILVAFGLACFGVGLRGLRDA